MASRVRRRLYVVLTAVLLSAGGLGPAHAADSYWESGYWENDASAPDVVEDCRTGGNKLDMCHFHITRVSYGRGKWHNLGRKYYNCTARRK